MPTIKAGPAGNWSIPLQPDRFGEGQPAPLLIAQYRARFDQIEAHRAAKFGQGGGRAQQIAGEHAAPRPELGDDHRIGPADLFPDDGAPQPDQLAEDLADLGRGDEIAGAAERLSGRVIAEFRIVQRDRHVGRQGQRPLGADAAGDPVDEHVAGHGAVGSGRRRAHRMTTMPVISTGIDNSWPSVVPSHR